MSTETESKEVRHLYVPSKAVSWEAQVDRAVRLTHEGLEVYVHRHGDGRRCVRQGAEGPNSSPNGWCARIELTDDGESTNVLPISKTEPETAKLD